MDLALKHALFPADLSQHSGDPLPAAFLPHMPEDLFFVPQKCLSAEHTVVCIKSICQSVFGVSLRHLRLHLSTGNPGYMDVYAELG